jgi:SpoVK/Ycf46/Vps4 family AAA+-type ATPase
MSAINRLTSYIEALRPILYIPTFDFYSFDNIISKISENEDIYEYNEGLGYVNFKTKKQESDYSLEQFLKLFQTQQKKPVYLVLKDIHKQLEDTKIISLLKTMAFRTMYEENYNITIFIVSTRLVIPVELEKLITIYDTPLPNENKIIEIVDDFAVSMGIEIEESLERELALYFKGFGEFEIIQILNLAYQRSGAIKDSDIEFILEEKKQIIKKSGMVEILDFKENVDDIGGLENLKEWLRNKAKIFNQLEKAIEFGVDIPKGIMIVGMPGCGKSLTAKATAKLFNVPLLRLDVGKLLGKYVGESEDNMRRAISITEAVAPCILWIDEIEKAFAGVGGANGNEVTTRLFGYFLTWMQEKNSSVFVVATSNDISNLPAEFLRKGRFDEIFFVDLPNDDERKNIFELHLKKRGKWNKDIDSIKLIKESKEYSGADIEAVIKDCIEKSFIINKSKIETEDLLNVIKTTKPMAISLKDKIEKLRETLAKLDVKNASRK